MEAEGEEALVECRSLALGDRGGVGIDQILDRPLVGRGETRTVVAERLREVDQRPTNSANQSPARHDLDPRQQPEAAADEPGQARLTGPEAAGLDAVEALPGGLVEEGLAARTVLPGAPNPTTYVWLIALCSARPARITRNRPVIAHPDPRDCAVAMAPSSHQ